MRNVDKDDLKFLFDLYGISEQDQLAMHMAVIMQMSNMELADGILALLAEPNKFDECMGTALLYVVAMRMQESDKVIVSYN